jgi:hypothetical protein
MLRTILLLGIIFGATNCQSIYHRYITKGRVVSVNGNEGVICIGSKDGAQVGQIWRTSELKIQGTGKTSKFIWVPVGSVKILEIVDEHYARVSVIAGKLEIDYVAELQTL